jgi:ubiquinone/menaquinone biosynthesis C-methylase UbiE
MNSNVMKRMWNQRAQLDTFFYIETKFWNGDLDAFFNLGEERAQLILDPVIPELTIPAKQASVLEIGCGVGRFSRALAKRFSKVIAVDVSDEMIRQARQLSSYNDYPNLEFHATDGVTMAFVEAASIDFVFSYEVFQHMPSVEVVSHNFKEIRRILKPSGLALIHLRTESSFSWKKVRLIVKKLLPESVWKLIGVKPLTFDKTWIGLSLNHQKIQQLCQSNSLKLLQFREDPTHSPGERIFALVTPI